MLIKFRTVLLMATLTVLSLSCSKEYRKAQKTLNSDEKFSYGVKMYQDGKYGRAVSFLEDAQPFFRGKDRYDQLVYTLGWAYFYDKNYYMAGHTFLSYSRLFPKSDKVEECFFQGAYSLVLDIPFYKLDQSSAYEAMKQLQLFINYYPDSPKVSDCNIYMDQIRQMLSQKDFSLARNYYRRTIYNSAAVGFKNLVKNYPESSLREEAMFMELKCLYLFARGSISSKQLDRYYNVRKAFELFERSYYQSAFLAEAKLFDSKAAQYIESRK